MTSTTGSRRWVREEDLAGELKLPPRKLRSTLQFLEKEKLVARDRRGGTAYSCTDDAQMYDVVRKRYSSMDTLYLMSMEDDGSCFHCESCDGELVIANLRVTAMQGRDGVKNSKTRFRGWRYR
ncbi:unnamed protein product [Prunus brigantina]